MTRQSAPNLRRKLQKLALRLQIPIKPKPDVALQGFSHRDRAEKAERTQCGKQWAREQARMIAVTISSTLQPQGHPERCFTHGPKRPSSKPCRQRRLLQVREARTLEEDLLQPGEPTQTLSSLQAGGSLEKGLPSAPKEEEDTQSIMAITEGDRGSQQLP